MKKYLLFLFFIPLMSIGQVGINNENPDPSSALDVTSTSGGILIPRMTKTQRDAISSPATGLMIYQTDDTADFYYFNGSSWSQVGAAASQGSQIASIGDYRWDIPGWKFNQLNGDIETYVTLDTYICFPIKINKQTSFSEFGLFRDYSSDDGTDHIMIAVLSSNNGFPGSVVEDLGVIDVPDQGSNYQFHSKANSFNLAAGDYFVAISVSENSIGNLDGTYSKLVNAVNYVSGSSHNDSPAGQITKINNSGLSISTGTAYKFSKPLGELDYSSISSSTFVSMIDEPGSIIWFKTSN